MDTKEIREKLNTIAKSTATKHPKVLIAELCGVIGRLLEHIEKIENAPMYVLDTSSKPDVLSDPSRRRTPPLVSEGNHVRRVSSEEKPTIRSDKKSSEPDKLEDSYREDG